MQYTKFFSGLINNHGSLNLDPDQLKLVMNLVHLEGVIQGIKHMQSKDQINPCKYDYYIKVTEDKISSLTNAQAPSALLNSWKMEA